LLFGEVRQAPWQFAYVFSNVYETEGEVVLEKDGTLTAAEWLIGRLAEAGFEYEPCENEGDFSPDNAEDGDEAEELPQTKDGGNTGEDSDEIGEEGEPSETAETHLSIDTNNVISISYPLGGFTPETLDNLRKMVNSKAPLIKKALEVEELPIKEDGEELAFPWFKHGIPHEELMAYAQFVERLCKTAQAKQRVTATAPEEFDNERFSMRVWGVSLGLKGAEYATLRRLLQQNLSGNSGFRYADGHPRNPRGGERVEKQVLSVRFTADMLAKIEELAEQSGMSRNALIESIVGEYVQAETGAVGETAAPAEDGEALEMTEREELGLGNERQDPIGEDGMQATDCDDEEAQDDE